LKEAEEAEEAEEVEAEAGVEEDAKVVDELIVEEEAGNCGEHVQQELGHPLVVEWPGEWPQQAKAVVEELPKYCA
jgi:hypothetical protein